MAKIKQINGEIVIYNYVSKMIQDIVLHPFIALRRTCQVNRKCSPFVSIQPFSLMFFMYHQQRKQGILALYKGLSSELLVKGMTLGTVTGVANYLEWPTEISSKRYFEDSIKLALIRGISVAITTPFICSSVIETVQSVIVVKDRPAFIDCLKEGFFRLLHSRSNPSTRIIPIWLLVAPTVFYHLAHSALKQIAENFVDMFKASMCNSHTSRDTPKRSHKKSSRHNRSINTTNISGINQLTNLSSMNDTSMWDPYDEDLTMTYDNLTDTTSNNIYANNIKFDSNKISTSIIAGLIADITLLPVETIINCLYIQGTRTIIDNCDETTVVLPVLTNYEGFTDCYKSIIRFEGSLGLYKGLGAVILQYSVHYLLFRSICYVLNKYKNNTIL